MKITNNILSSIFLILLFLSCGQKSNYDVILVNGQIIDGTGSTPIRSDIGIKNGLIERIGDLSNAKADRVIDAKELIVSPGFIDLHAHLDPIVKLPKPNCYPKGRKMK